MTTTTAAGQLTFRRVRLEHLEEWMRYDLILDGVKVGWVDRPEAGAPWSAHALTGGNAFRGMLVARGETFRRDAAFEVLLSVMRLPVDAWDVATGHHQVDRRESARAALDAQAHWAGR